MTVIWPGPKMEGSSGGEVGAVGEPTPISDVGLVTSGRDVGTEGEPMSAPEGEHVGAVGEPTWQGGSGRGGGSGAGESSSCEIGLMAGSAAVQVAAAMIAASGEAGGEAPAPSSCVIGSKAGSAASGEVVNIAFFLFVLLVTLGEVARRLLAK